VSSVSPINNLVSQFGLSRLGNGPTYDRPKVGERYFDLFNVVSEFIKPKIILEVGTWEGRSAISWGNIAKNNGGMLICVDTWLGSTEHYENALPTGEWQRGRIFLEDGYPSIYKTFVTTMRNNDLQNHVIPIPIDSYQAFIILDKANVSPDVTYVDASHDYNSVLADLNGAKRIGSKIICGDDYYYFEHTGIQDAVKLFANENGMKIQEKECQFILTNESTKHLYDFLKIRGWQEQQNNNYIG
jgi:hypothetical protein